MKTVAYLITLPKLVPMHTVKIDRAASELYAADHHGIIDELVTRADAHAATMELADSLRALIEECKRTDKASLAYCGQAFFYPSVLLRCRQALAAYEAKKDTK